MKQENLIKQLEADMSRIHQQIQQGLRDLDSKIDYLIELHRECRQSMATTCAGTQIYNGGDDE